MEATIQTMLFPVIEEKLSKWAPLRRFLDANEEHGGLATQAMVAESLGVSRARVGQLVEAGRLATVTCNGRRYVSVQSLELFLTEERKTGVHIGTPSYVRMAKASLDQTWS